ncbi:MAG TPA: TAT-variant-translocated molybdopterin oxidoreductase, partial [Deinococcales bacterium]|nr:TAT-variant-translocated molybdopterin oxidoreductase [Deinococcales bacterium]
MLDLPPMTKEPMDISTLREKLAGESGPRFWRSLEELGDNPEFQEYLHEEFPRQAAPLESAVDRRGFLKFLGASLALAGLTACARPLSAAEKVVPYVRQPEEIIPGKPLFYASAISANGYAEGVLVESHQGRPTKLEGNADHPASLGATTAVTQASILSLYDPDRSQEVLKSGSNADWEEFLSEARAALEANPDGSGVVLVTEPVTSPSLAARIRSFLEERPEARWVQHDPTGLRGIYTGTELAFGEPLMPDYDLREADVVVSFGADFISDYPGRLRYAKHLSERRRIRSASDDMNRLYVFEPSPSPLGAI